MTGAVLSVAAVGTVPPAGAAAAPGTAGSASAASPCVATVKACARLSTHQFFDTHGRAFHAGDPSRQSAGCIRLPTDAAKAFFDALQPGDQVQILP